MNLLRVSVVMLLLGAASACSNTDTTPMQTVAAVDIQRFMGRWHVLADVATPFDRRATNPIEHYSLNADGTIATTYSFEVPGEARRRTMRAKGYVRDSNNAVWGMQFIWPLRADYRIVHLDDNYETAVVARARRDFVWILARKPRVDDATLSDLLNFVADVGYDVSELRLHQQPAIDAAPAEITLP